MPNHLTHLAGLAVAATLVLSGAAQAQQHPKRVKVAAPRQVILAEISARPLTVQKRSFLDPGNVVAPGSNTPEYVAANTTELQQVYTSYAPARFGESTLPGRFDLPDNPRFYPNQDLDFSPF